MGLTLVVAIMGGSVACGSESSSSNEATASTTTVTTPPTTTSTVAPTTTASPTAQAPSCDEVQTVLAQMSPSDVATLEEWQMLFVSRLVGSNDGWRILTQPTGSSPSGAVYFDWTPATGLSSPIDVSSPEEAAALRSASLILITMRCATPIMPPDLSGDDWVPVNP